MIHWNNYILVNLMESKVTSAVKDVCHISI